MRQRMWWRCWRAIGPSALAAVVATAWLAAADVGAVPVLVPRTLADARPVGVAAVVAPAFPVDFVGAVWDGDDLDGHGAEVRFRHDGIWSTWLPMGEDGVDAPGRTGTGLVAGGGADAYEARGLPATAMVTAINTTTGPLVEVGRRPAHAAGAAPPCRSRADWGADESIRTNVPTYVAPQVLTIHHTATTTGADPAATMRAVYRFHTVDEGFGDIGYQYVVDQNGVVYEGRWSGDSTSCVSGGGTGTDFGHTEDGTDRAVVGAHVGGWNSGNIGVAFLGTFTDDLPTDAQLSAGEAVLAALAQRHDIEADDTDYLFVNPVSGDSKTVPRISGHRDWLATECPGGALYDELPAIRSRVAAAPPEPTTTTTSSTTTTTLAPTTTTTTTAPPRTTTTTAPPPPAARSGYWMLSADGTVFPFGDAVDAGSVPLFGAVDIEPTPSGNGYWVVDGAGNVVGFGDAPVQSAPPELRSGERVTSLSSAGRGRGYWLFTSAGRVIPFGGAPYFGDMDGVRLNAPVLDSIPTASGNGYYMVAADGGIFTFGDAEFWGSMGSVRLNAPVQSLVPNGDGDGYWLVASDGGIFTFGGAVFRGSMGDVRLNRPVTGMVADGSAGYLMVAEDGGIFTFGTARFHGSLGDRPPTSPVTAVAALTG